MFDIKSIKTQLIIFLLALGLFLGISDKDAGFLAAIAIAAFWAMAAEAAFLYFKQKSLKITESAIISGLIAGFVLSSDEPGWKLALAAVLAIASKQVIHFRNRHIFNPAACGIFLATVIFGSITEWRGTYLWQVLAPFGIYFAWRMKKLEVLVGYALVALILFGTQAFGYSTYFYIFIMVIEPKTTPIRPLGKYLFGVGVAGLIFISTQKGARFDVELVSLLAMNALVPLLNYLPSQR
ncbi:MAG: RnfABCDGE type electron transport complex subunit D [Candidatus Omnitrophota bacterium]